MSGQALSCIEGHAGTGKSYLLAALKDAYEESNYVVRALGPDNATAKVLKEKGFNKSENIYRFLFTQHYRESDIKQGKEVWVVDEAGKLGNKALLELLKVAEKNQVQLIFSGNTAQLPSVGRGGTFKGFCERYGCEFLENIQRQKVEQQRQIAKQLAVRKVSQAFDMIHSSGGIFWSENKKETIESTIKSWAADKMSLSGTSILVAHTNAEVRVLNEMARLYRKEQREIGRNEYECQTSFGKIFVSEGDLVEFRKNDKDLRVNNGTTGVLIKASSSEFIVSVKEGKKEREVTFDPNKYASFQLGYATTFYRSQGRTVDRAYILHSQHMNKEMFYVGLTRHVRASYCFVSRTEATCLSDLKRQAMRSGQKESVYDYVTQDDLHLEKRKEQRDNQIHTLIDSDSMVDRTKGRGLKAWDSVRLTVGRSFETFTDRKPEETFYNPVLSETDFNGGKVVEQREDLSLATTFQDYLSKFKEERVSIDQIFHEPVEEQKNEQQQERNSKQLSSQQQSLLKGYYQKSDEASSLYEIVCVESEEQEKTKEGTSHFSAWRKACAERNQLASDVVQSVPSKELKSIFSEKAYYILTDRNQKYMEVSAPKENLERKLSENIEPLLYRLFPEGPTRRDKNGYRFGRNGSLSVVCAGPKSGSYYDFSEEEGGGLVSLVQKVKGLDASQAKEWSKRFLGESPTIDVPKQYSTQSFTKEEKDPWMSVKPPKSATVPSLEKISPYLFKKYQLATQHTYHDKEGNVLFYTLRLQDKETPSKKVVLPLSFGYFSGRGGEPKWQLKKYRSEKGTPLYNQHLLNKDLNKSVLIVEGEKTADAGEKLFGNDVVCVSWLGGSGGVSKVDWSPLIGRQVIIWPDNDQAGYSASEKICSSLKRMGVKSLQVVDQKLLSELPKKWDLADSLPEGKDELFLRDCLLRAEQKAVPFDRILHLAKESKESEHLEPFQLNEILVRVDERLRGSLEKEHGAKTWKIENGICDGVRDVFSKKEDLVKLVSNIETDPKRAERLVYQSFIHCARTGDLPSEKQLKEIGSVLSNCTEVLAQEKGSKEVREMNHLVDRMTSSVLEEGIRTNEGIERFVDRNQEWISLQIENQREIVVEVHPEKELGRER